jgi:hypothetical protein
VFNAAPNVLLNEFHLARLSDEFFERARQSADAALDSWRQQRGQQIEQAIRVLNTLFTGPIRQVYLLFNATSVKLPERKTINRENVAAVSLQPPLEFQQAFCIEQLARRLVTQPEPDGELIGASDLVSYGKGPAVEGIERLRPGFTGMNVSAVGQVQPVVKFHGSKRILL